MLASLGLEASVCMYVSVCLSVYLSTCESAGVTGAELAMADYSSTDGPIGAVNDLHKSTAKLSVPVVDLADLSHAKEALAAACTDWGFFQVINHGVSMELVQRLRKQSLDLFALPLEQKEKAGRPEGSILGYQFRPDSGPMEVFQVVAWDALTMADYGNKLFPDTARDFCAVFEEANAAFRKLAMEILELVIEALGVDAHHFEVYKREAQGQLRANYYHPSNSKDEVHIGLKPHVDGNLLTILHQQDVSGLEVLKDGRWFRVAPQMNAFCVNVADILQVLTNGRFKSVLHRAVVPKTEPRLSVVYFLKPPESIELVSAPELVDISQPALYRPFTWTEFREAHKGNDRFASALPYFEHKRIPS